MKEFQKYIVTILFNGESRSVEIDKPSFIIGRSSEADITLSYELLSRKHVKLTYTDHNVLLEELGASNGSWLDGVKLKTKKPIPYASHAKIVLGNNKGPVITVEIVCQNKQEDARQVVEEVTLVRRNPLLDQVKTENKVVVIRSEPVVAKVIAEPVMQKVANGSVQTSWQESAPSPAPAPAPAPKIQLVDSEASSGPDLISRMKSMLNSEAESVLKNAKAEAEKLIADATRVARSTKDQAQKEADAIKAKIENEKKSANKTLNDELEKSKKENTKAINQLLASAQKQSQELLDSSSAEAEEARSEAKKFADDLISTNRTKAASAIKEADYIVKLKLEELKKSEEEIQLNTKILDEIYRELKSKVDLLKKQENDARISYETLSKSIERDESRMNSERSSLESLRTHVQNAQKECDQQLAELQLEERRFKTQMETELLEQKLKVTQIQSEHQQAQIQKDTITAEINFIKLDKDQTERLLRETEAESQKAQQVLDDLKAQESKALENLTQIQSDHQSTLEDIAAQQENIALALKDLQSEKSAVADFKKQTEDQATESAETIKSQQALLEKEKNEHASFIENEKKTFEKLKLELSEELAGEKKKLEAQKSDLALELENEKKKMTKTLREEAQKTKLALEEEIKKIIEQKTHTTMLANQTKLETEQVIKNGKEEVANFQRSLKLENERLKIEAHREFMVTKDKLDQVIMSANREHEEVKKKSLLELNRLEKEKTNVQKEIQELGHAHEKKLSELETELRSEVEKAKKKAAQDVKHIEAEAIEQRGRIEEMKQSEMYQIQQLKESALKDIYGKKNERAKTVSIAVDTIVLSELTKSKYSRINDAFIVNFSKEISTIVLETLMDRYSPDKHRLDAAKQEAAQKLERVIAIKKFFKKVGLTILCVALAYAAFQVYNSPDFLPVKKEILKGVQSVLEIDLKLN